MNSNHELYMKRCIELASMGLGFTSPNPMVGSVIVHDGKIIGEGYHQVYGEAHAEVNAINSVKNKDLLQNSILYVSLEPCSHHGKTPPCADLIIRMKIPKVVVGSLDPNPLVSGSGIEKLRQSGCEVTTGILSEDCEVLNKRFFTFMRQKRPYIILKWAETEDGFIDKIRTPDENPKWITNHMSKILVHKWRSEEQAIMIGTNTAIMDNPQLNVREWSGLNPVRIVLDLNGRLPLNLHLFDGSIRTLVYTSFNNNPQLANVEYIGVPDSADKLNFIMNHLYENKILSVLVEGGTKLISSFIEKNLWDEARVFKGKTMFYNGVRAPQIIQKPHSEYYIDDVNLKYYFNHKNV